MRYYIDCEFDGHNGPLLSMAIVCDEFVNMHITVINKATIPNQTHGSIPLSSPFVM